MKRVRCPKCDNYITFDETQYSAGQSLVFQCPECGKQFGIRIGVSKLRDTQKVENNVQAPDESKKAVEANVLSFDATGSRLVLNSSDKVENNVQAPDKESHYGYITVIENVFHYKQVIPLQMGDNVIGRYQKGNPINTPFETVDPSVDLNHCTLTVSRDKKGRLRYTLRDNNSNTGTFVDNVEIPPRERRIIDDGTLFTIGATSIILKTNEEQV